MDETAWLDQSLAAWRLTRSEILRAEGNPTPPTLVFYNDACRFEGEGGPPWRSDRHDGAVALPDGSTLPPQVASFASPYDHGNRVFFAMALPSIWGQAGVQSELGLETLMTAVLIHETTHTLQYASFSHRIDAIDQRYGIGDALSDDIVQHAFRDNADYVAAYEAERDLLYRAAASSSDAEARSLAAEALRRIEARRARFFVGDHAKLLELEDIFLTMEGVAQWAAYLWLERPDGRAIDRAAALLGMRRGGRQWSQDEGLALFLVIDRLVPDWQARAFAVQPATALELLAVAAGAPPG